MTTPWRGLGRFVGTALLSLLLAGCTSTPQRGEDASVEADPKVLGVHMRLEEPPDGRTRGEPVTSEELLRRRGATKVDVERNARDPFAEPIPPGRAAPKPAEAQEQPAEENGEEPPANPSEPLPPGNGT